MNDGICRYCFTSVAAYRLSGVRLMWIHVPDNVVGCWFGRGPTAAMPILCIQEEP